MSRGFLLDTNIPSELTRPEPEVRVTAWMHTQANRHLYLSAISIGEIRRGIRLLPQGNRQRRLEQWLDRDVLDLFAGQILPVTRAIAEQWAVLSAARQRRGKPLSMADGLIAATALEHDLILVTRNTKDFANLGLQMLDLWSIPA